MGDARDRILERRARFRAAAIGALGAAVTTVTSVTLSACACLKTPSDFGPIDGNVSAEDTGTSPGDARDTAETDDVIDASDTDAVGDSDPAADSTSADSPEG